ncbi:UNKNOWN [Stylonychia lemnae]|uniref:Uncharacterized protein n=1 Tax=Stylonychia lemnae TaxID=5949 RepID=A0A078A8Y1_STYLE|nr:UNKNOWN [Stylonychia lemnae]|eukprot:CDW78674.1 UNKNOWN [Stylonychia lemnae]
MENRCKARATCDDNHSKHYCRICSNRDSDHSARDCPSGITLYHGPGIYFANGKIAEQVSKYRGNGTGIAIFKCRVNEAYCIQGIHPKWIGVTADTFDEWCLLDHRKYRIIGIALMDGVIEGNINLPREEIIISGTCEIKGKVTARRISVGKALF